MLAPRVGQQRLCSQQGLEELLGCRLGKEVAGRSPVPQLLRIATPSMIKRTVILANIPRICTYFLNLMLRLIVNSPSPARYAVLEKVSSIMAARDPPWANLESGQKARPRLQPGQTVPLAFPQSGGKTTTASTFLQEKKGNRAESCLLKPFKIN